MPGKQILSPQLDVPSIQNFEKTAIFTVKRRIFLNFPTFEYFGQNLFFIMEAHLVSKDAKFHGKFDKCSEIVQIRHFY